MISRSRFNITYKEMTSASQKVYAAVPIAQMWTVPQIAAELRRTGVSMAINSVAGCLGGLVHSGMVREPIRGQFRRVEIKEASQKLSSEPILYEAKKEIMSQPTAKIAVTSIKKTPLEILGELSARAIVLADMVKALAADLENSAIEIQHQIESTESETGKLKQLQAILKSLG